VWCGDPLVHPRSRLDACSATCYKLHRLVFIAEPDTGSAVPADLPRDSHPRHCRLYDHDMPDYDRPNRERIDQLLHESPDVGHCPQPRHRV